MTYMVGGIKYSIRLSDHPDYALRIADAISLWSTDEHLLSHVFSILSGTDKLKSSMLIGGIESSKARLGLIEAAGELTLKNHALLGRFKDLMAEATKCLIQRNVYAHAVYALNETGQLCRVHLKFDLHESPKAITVVSLKDLDVLLTRLSSTYQQAIALIESLWTELPREYVQAFQALDMQRALLGLPSKAAPSPVSHTKSATHPSRPPED